MAPRQLARLVLMGLAQSSLAFVLWPLVETEALSDALQISTECINALNTTVLCDQDLFQWTVDVDRVWWTRTNTTQLCTQNCVASAQSWHANVGGACASEWLIQGDRLVEAETLAGRFVDGLGLACLQSESTKEWCFVAQQEWTGSDIITPDCNANPSHPYCNNPANVTAEQQRISSLYDNDLLCDECFLRLMYTRVTSDFLPDTDHSDYLVNEFQDIQDICQTTVGELATRAPPEYPSTTDAIDMKPIGTATTTATTTATSTAIPEPADANCTAGQWVNVFLTWESTQADTDIEFCNELAELYGVATGDLMVTTGSVNCGMDPETEDYYENEEGWFCASKACSLMRVSNSSTCESIAAQLSNTTQPVSAVQVATWNPNILGACDHLTPDQYICITRPGGSWVSPPASEIPDDGDGPVRGGPGSTPSLPILENPATRPADVQEGIAQDCTRFIMANSTTASCWKMANDAQITQDRLFELNPVLGKDGEFCQTQVWLGYYYCVGTAGTGPTQTQTPTITPTQTTSRPPTTTPTAGPVPAPGPTHDGVPQSCNKWATGPTCWDIGTAAGISQEQLYEWNPALGPNGEQCATMIWPGYYYCVGVAADDGGPTQTSELPTVTPTPTAGPVPAPGPTHDGVAPDCNEWATGPSCWDIANGAGITLDQLFQWNDALGPNGEQCSTMIWPGYYYCVGVVGLLGG